MCFLPHSSIKINCHHNILAVVKGPICLQLNPTAAALWKKTPNNWLLSPLLITNKSVIQLQNGQNAPMDGQLAEPMGWNNNNPVAFSFFPLFGLSKPLIKTCTKHPYRLFSMRHYTPVFLYLKKKKKSQGFSETH